MKTTILRKTGLAVVCAAFASGAAFAAAYPDTALVTVTASGVLKYSVTNGVWYGKTTLIPNSGSYDSHTTLLACAIDVVGDTIYIGRDDEAVVSGNKILKFDLKGNYLGVFKRLDHRVNTFIHSQDQRYLYATAQSPYNKIYRYDLTDGTEEVLVPTTGWTDEKGGTVSESLNMPRQICWGPNGELVVMSRGPASGGTGNAYAFNAQTGRYIAKLGTVPNAKGGVVYDPVRNLYFLSNSSGNCIGFNTDGTQSASTIALGASASNVFTGQSWENNLYFGCWNSSKVYKYDAAGAVTTAASSVGSVNQLVIYRNLRQSIKAAWDFEDAEGGASFANSVTPSQSPIQGFRRMRNAVAGVSGKGAWFDEASYGIIRDSAGLLPAVGDFSVFLWAGKQGGGPAGEHYLLGNNPSFNETGRCGIIANFSGGESGCVGWLLNGGANLASTSTFTDGRWHHVGVIRRGGRFELWMDGVCEASADVAESVALSAVEDWRVCDNGQGLANVRGGPCAMDSLQVYGAALEAEDVATLFARGAVADMPARPAEPQLTFSPSAAEAFGTVVDHAYAVDCGIGDPSIIRLPDGTFLLARDCGSDLGDDAGTVVYRSTDGAATWTPVCTNGLLSRASLCLTGSRVRLFGMIRSGLYVRLGTSTDSGATWSFDTFYTVSGAFQNSAPPMVWNGRLWKSGYSGLPGLRRHCTVSAALAANGDLSDWKCSPSQQAFPGTAPSPFGPYGIGSLCSTPDGNAVCLSPAGFKPGWVGTVKAVPECSGIFGIGSSSSAPDTRNTADRVMLPGSSKPFHVAFDAESGRYWAVTTAAHVPSDGANVPSDTVLHRLCLYSSLTVRDWTYHGTIVEGTPGTNGFNAPAFAFDGDDLVVAFAAACPDGTTAGPRSLTEGNFLVTRRVTGFRSLVPDRSTPARLLVCDAGRNRVMRYYRNGLGEWCADGIFVSPGTYGGKSLGTVNSVGVQGNSVFVLSGSAGGSIFEFSLRGKFRRVVMTFKPRADEPKNRMESLALSPDGHWIYVSEGFDTKDTKIWRVDRATGAYETFVAHTGWGGTFGTPRGLYCDAAGRLYVADRAQGVYRFLPDGTLDATLIPQASANQVQCVLPDDSDGCLYAGFMGTAISRYPYSDMSKPVTVFTTNPYGNALQIGKIDGKVNAGAYYTGVLMGEDGTDLGACTIVGLEYIAGWTYVPDINSGMMLLIR